MNGGNSMIKVISLFMALAILFAGCSSFTLIKTETDYLKANKKFENRNVTVSLNNGEIIKAENVFVKADSISLLDTGSNIKRLIPTPEVEKIVLHNVVEKTIKGCITGFLVSIPCWALLITDTWYKSPPSVLSGSALFKLGGYLGAFMGLISGINGDFYRFFEPESKSIPSVVLENHVVVEGKVVVISEKVGEVIDLQERDKYNLFQGVKEFQSAELRQLNDSTFYFYVTCSDTNSKSVELMELQIDKEQIKRVREHIDQSP
jgi:hypothetical protein